MGPPGGEEDDDRVRVGSDGDYDLDVEEEEDPEEDEELEGEEDPEEEDEELSGGDEELEEDASGDEELQAEEEEEVDGDGLEEFDEEDVDEEEEEEVGVDSNVEEDGDDEGNGEDGIDEEEGDALEEFDEEDVEEEEEVGVDNSEEETGEDMDDRVDEVEEDDVGAENNEDEEEDDEPSVPTISSEKDATGLDRLPGERLIGFENNTNGRGNKTEHTKDIEPRILTKVEPVKHDNVEPAYRLDEVKEMQSECENKETSQHVCENDAEDIVFCALHGESRGIEADATLTVNPLISVEPGNKVDCGSEEDESKEMKSEGEKEICQHINNKDVRDGYAYAQHNETKRIATVDFLSTNLPISVESEPVRNETMDSASECKGPKTTESDCGEKGHNNKIGEIIPSSDSKGTAEVVKPPSAMGLDSESILMQEGEGGVEDMELDSEENIARGSDVDGTVVDSCNENVVFNSHHEVSFNTSAHALNNQTVVIGSLKSPSVERKDSTLGESKNMNLDLKGPKLPKAPSMVAAPVKQISFPPATELMDSNKRPAIICSYYAKGWCIKGNSCRFRHVKDNKDSINIQQDRDIESANGENQVNEGAKDFTKTIYPEQHAESHTHMQQLGNKTGYSSLQYRLLHPATSEFGCGIIGPSSIFASRLRPSIVNPTHIFNDPLQSIANRYINLDLQPSAARDIYSSRDISPFNEYSNPIVSLNSKDYGAHKITRETIDFDASSSSRGVTAERDRLTSLELTPKAVMYKWEPSKPFRPSYYFSIPSGSSSGSMYDPLRDSIEHTSMATVSFKAERIHYPSHQKYPDSASEGNHLDVDGFSGTMPDRYGHIRVTEAEAAGSSVADQDNLGSAPGGDKGSGTSNGRDLSEINKTSVSAEKRSKFIKEKIHSNGAVVDKGLTEDDMRESKTFRQFRVALIEFIKELLKPAWRVGNLSKDAHNIIVKKAVKKVLNSLHSHQVPCTPESVEQYLSASQLKIIKLLEAYVQKHSKT